MRTNEQLARTNEPNNRTTNDAARQLRRRQAKRNENVRRAILDAIESTIPYAPRLIEFPNEIVVRTKYENHAIFRAKYLRTSTHFPGIVPELVNDSGGYMLITWLTFGSLLRLLKEVRQGNEIKNFDFFM
jgi:hypothetical protein